jgi:hypothetical protein
MPKNTSISLGDHFANFIDQQVQGGRYGSASDVVRAGPSAFCISAWTCVGTSEPTYPCARSCEAAWGATAITFFSTSLSISA